MKLPEVRETTQQVTVPLVQRKVGSHYKAYNALTCYRIWSSKQPWKVYIIIILYSLEMKKMKPREVKRLVHSYSGNGRQSRDFHLGLLVLKQCLFCDATPGSEQCFSRAESLSGSELITKKHANKGLLGTRAQERSAAPAVQAEGSVGTSDAASTCSSAQIPVLLWNTGIYHSSLRPGQPPESRNQKH